MGRLLNDGIYGKENQLCFEDMRKRHRDADCKYRSNVQYLYFKMRSLLRKKYAKDSLLDNALGFIQDLENDIYQASGSDHMESVRDEFLVFLVHEDSIWKKEKDVTKWWTKVEDLICKDIPLDLRTKKKLLKKCKEKNQHSKPKKRGRPIKSESSTKSMNDTCCCINEHMPTLPSCNKVFLKTSEDSSARKNNVVSSSWIFPEVANFRPYVTTQNGNATPEETLSDDSMNSNSNDIFSETLPIEVSTAPVPVDISDRSFLEAPQKTQNSFLYL